MTPNSTPTIPALAVLVSLGVSTAGCAGRFEVTGGPRSVRVELESDKLLAGIRPLVAGDARATRRADEVRGRERTGKILLYSEFALLLGCLALTASSDPLEPTDTTYVGFGLCGATIAVGVAAVIALPGKETYGAPLRVYNESHPESPYVAPALGVNPPVRATGVASP